MIYSGWFTNSNEASFSFNTYLCCARSLLSCSTMLLSQWFNTTCQQYS